MQLLRTIERIEPRLHGGSFVAVVILSGPGDASSDVRVSPETLFDYQAFRHAVFAQAGDIFSPFDQGNDPTPGQWLKMIEAWAFKPAAVEDASVQ